MFSRLSASRQFCLAVQKKVIYSHNSISWPISKPRFGIYIYVMSSLLKYEEKLPSPFNFFYISAFLLYTYSMKPMYFSFVSIHIIFGKSDHLTLPNSVNNDNLYLLNISYNLFLFKKYNFSKSCSYF